jgi:hypothetical protein
MLLRVEIIYSGDSAVFSAIQLVVANADWMTTIKERTTITNITGYI